MAVNLSSLAGAGQQFFDNDGVPLTGGKLFSYAAGTTTPQTTYTSITGLTAHSNPIILDSAGRVPGGEIWLTAGSNYKFVLTTSLNVLIATWDNITGINGTGITSNATNVEYDPPFIGSVSTNVELKLSEIPSINDFGGVGNGSTSNNAALTAADNSGLNVIIIPEGTYRLASASAPAVNLLGFGGIFQQDVGTFFPKQLLDFGSYKYTYSQRTFLAADYTATPVENYTEIPEGSNFRFRLVNFAGYQEKDTAGKYSGSNPPGLIPPGQTRLARTGIFQTYLLGSHSGFGDCYNMFWAMAASQHPDSNLNTFWAGQNSAGMAGGQCNALTDKVNLYGIGDVVLDDNSNEDVSMLGHVTFLNYNGTESGTYDIPRFGQLIQSSGTKYIDALYIGRGRTYVAADYSGATITGAAIALAQDQKIAWGATPVSTATGKFSTQSVNTTYTAFNGSFLTDTVAGVDILKRNSARIEINPSVNSPDTLRIYGSSATTFFQAGQFNDTTLISAGSTATDNTTLSFRTANAGVENIVLSLNNVGNATPGTDNAQTLGSAAARWSEIYGTSLKPGAGTVIWTSGAGSPEGVVSAVVGSMYTRTDGGAGTTLYVKETGSGNTGWVAK